jgi:hypothetical protein
MKNGFAKNIETGSQPVTARHRWRSKDATRVAVLRTEGTQSDVSPPSGRRDREQIRWSLTRRHSRAGRSARAAYWEYFSEKEPTLQTGHEPERWTEVVIKELIDNALDACEEAWTLPEIAVAIHPDAVTVQDNGPGLPPSVVEWILDFTVRASNKEACISPTRGAQGNENVGCGGRRPGCRESTRRGWA